MKQYFEKGTFNTVSYGGTGEIGGSFPVWARIENRLVGGGHFAVGDDGLTPGTIVPAGTMVKPVSGAFKPGCEIEVTENAEECIGLVDNDVVIPDNCVLATAAIVVKGRIYADRVKVGSGYGLPAALAAKLPMIEFVREA